MTVANRRYRLGRPMAQVREQGHLAAALLGISRTALPDSRHKGAPMRSSTWRRPTAVAAVLLGAGLAAVAVPLAAHLARCSGVIVTPSSNIQKLIDSNRAGSTFCFQPGTYTNASQLEPQSNDVFDGDGQQAVLDGGNNYQFAFYGDANGTGPSGVTIQNFKIQNYATPLQRGVIQDYNGPNWVIQGNDIEHNAAAAVATGDDVQVLNNKLDNNAQEGFSAHGTGGLYQGNDISDNNDELGSDPYQRLVGRLGGRRRQGCRHHQPDLQEQHHQQQRMQWPVDGYRQLRHGCRGQHD